MLTACEVSQAKRGFLFGEEEKMALYEKHKFRRSIQLDGVWNFLPDPQNNGKDAHW